MVKKIKCIDWGPYFYYPQKYKIYYSPMIAATSPKHKQCQYEWWAGVLASPKTESWKWNVFFGVSYPWVFHVELYRKAAHRKEKQHYRYQVHQTKTTVGDKKFRMSKKKGLFWYADQKRRYNNHRRSHN